MADILNFPGSSTGSSGASDTLRTTAYPDFPVQTVEIRRVHQPIVDALKEALECAQRGDIQSFAICWVSPDQSCTEGWMLGEGSNNYHTLMASITYLQHRYAQARLTVDEQPELPTVS